MRKSSGGAAPPAHYQTQITNRRYKQNNCWVESLQAFMQNVDAGRCRATATFTLKGTDFTARNLQYERVRHLR